MAKKKKGGKKGGNNAQADKNDNAELADLDDLMAEFDDVEVSKPEATPAASNADGEQGLTKAQLKRLRKKQKEEELAKSGGKKPEPAAEAAPAESNRKGSKKKGKKGGGMLAALKAQQAALREEEERMRKEEEELRRREAEAERKAIEEEERAAREKEEREKRRAEERDRLRREGKLLTKKQKADKARAEAYIKQMEAMGIQIPQRAADGADTSNNSRKKSSRKSSKRDKKGKKDSAAKKEEEIRKALELAEEKRLEEESRRERNRVIEQERLDRERYENIINKEEYSDDELDDDELLKKVGMDGAAAGTNAAAPAAAAAVEEDVLESWDSAPAALDSWEDGGDDVLDSWDAEPAAPAADAFGDLPNAAAPSAFELRAEKVAAARKRLLEMREEAREQARKDLIALDDRIAERIRLEKEKKDAEEELRIIELEKQRKHQEDQARRLLSMNDDCETDENLRSPICCILGHVDTGKTKLLDKIRSTNVQDKEAGGITQQIGATYFPMKAIRNQTSKLNTEMDLKLDYDLPGLLVIDTPGHESFTNLRSRGSNLCDIAILVVDIMHGLEKQTIESLNLLKARRTPFIVALNKIDRCYGWKEEQFDHTRSALKRQPKHTQDEFEKRLRETITYFQEEGLNTALYWENPDPRKIISLVPTSAITGEGIPDLLMLLIQLTQSKMSKKLSYISELQCTVLEVKKDDGLGTTIDVVLVNGVLRRGDTIVICGLNGPIVTTVRDLLTPKPLKEMRVKGDYIHHEIVKAAMGIKIAATGLEHAIAGSQLLVQNPRDDIEDLKDEVMGDLQTILSRVDRSGHGVSVQASTIGSLEALLAFLEEMKIPVSGVAIGPVQRKDVMRAAVQNEYKEEYGTLLAFDVPVSADAKREAEEQDVTIFTADIIYHLFDMVTDYFEKIRLKRQDEAASEAVFPCIFEVIDKDHVFHATHPILLGVKILEGVLKVGTPLAVPARDKLFIGRIQSIEHLRVSVKEAKPGMEVAIKIDDMNKNMAVGRQFEWNDQIVSRVSRRSIDIMKTNFAQELKENNMELAKVLGKIKNMLEISN